MSFLFNHYNKWGFIDIPKTGGTSISSILKDIDNTTSPMVHDSIRVFEKYPSYHIFTMVRNPFTRLASAFLHETRKGKTNLDFGTFLKKSKSLDLILLPQSYYIESGKTDNNQVSFIGRYENFEKDVKYIFDKVGIKDSIPHLNRNPLYDKHPNLNQQTYYKYMYSEEWMKDWVRERYDNDFRIFNYDMDI